ncbi:MAG: SMC-Scp complex subunit ScpB [Clostridia bacterium]|nr:SMC-Scp complex subunit ScpB [Clostridia bacterium]MBR2327624.1 SMC-Scp complex subunit ScpB [Clostridia bacterium]
MDINELKGILESVIFAVGDAVSASFLADVTGTSPKEVNEALSLLAAELLESGRGIRLAKMEDKYQLCTKEQNGDYVKRALQGRKNSPLSNAALEVLAIIAYNQPTTKAYVEQIRGVESGQVIANLVSKELIEEKGRLDAPGRPILYATTTEFLRCFKIKSLSELPELPVIGGDNETLFVQEVIPGTEDVAEN